MIRQVRKLAVKHLFSVTRKSQVSSQVSVPSPSNQREVSLASGESLFSTSAGLENYRTYSCIVTASEGSFSHAANETLESLSDKFNELFEEEKVFESADNTLADGVLTAHLGEEFGIYVINKQAPNRQLWLSSPSSGPSRFDWDLERQVWVYKHTGETLHSVLDRELGELLGKEEVGFQKDCHMGGSE